LWGQCDANCPQPEKRALESFLLVGSLGAGNDGFGGKALALVAWALHDVAQQAHAARRERALAVAEFMHNLSRHPESAR